MVAALLLLAACADEPVGDRGAADAVADAAADAVAGPTAEAEGTRTLRQTCRLLARAMPATYVPREDMVWEAFAGDLGRLASAGNAEAREVVSVLYEANRARMTASTDGDLADAESAWDDARVRVAARCASAGSTDLREGAASGPG
ncbi:hypothetical protein E8D34_18885 [Nocardioides sp. GY 10113]|uniref:hypothetical protein n=1 Tax=Nocardioides sp. GY 10113 TaxID=2569761 RepID=UPI0010A79F6B|nr:hypothetical protein [Nocardioides sp. GY 10113]TIC80452.1 hypothetical protein E8D34_18885 [Nocardioides sp. GY 10113]